MKKTILKSLLIWLGIIPLAYLNGGLREIVLIPFLGQIGLSLSGLLLGGMIFVLAYVFIPKLGMAEKTTYVVMGLIWLIATILFESFLGVTDGKSLSEILTAYNLLTGNLWLMVVVFIGFLPLIIADIRNLLLINERKNYEE